MPRSTFVKAGIGLVVFLLLLSRCGGAEPEKPRDLNLTDELSVPGSDYRSEVHGVLDQLSGIDPNGMDGVQRLPTLDDPLGGLSNPNALTREDFLDVWQLTTTPYDPACTESCEEVAVREGDGHGVYGARLIYNPKVDDPVAQWSDCVMSISVCFQVEADDNMDQREMDDVLKVCVQKSQCPSRCRDAFRAKVEGISQWSVDEELENVFVGEHALCLPQEAWVD